MNHLPTNVFCIVGVSIGLMLNKQSRNGGLCCGIDCGKEFFEESPTPESEGGFPITKRKGFVVYSAARLEKIDRRLTTVCEIVAGKWRVDLSTLVPEPRSRPIHSVERMSKAFTLSGPFDLIMTELKDQLVYFVPNFLTRSDKRWQCEVKLLRLTPGKSRNLHGAAVSMISGSSSPRGGVTTGDWCLITAESSEISRLDDFEVFGSMVYIIPKDELVKIT
ncbi:hypothetical protein MMC18_007636 [Xylographa bjoerkii]|nr:hypothetical protein [Xylographa bjoerkii]